MTLLDVLDSLTGTPTTVDLTTTPWRRIALDRRVGLPAVGVLLSVHR